MKPLRGVAPAIKEALRRAAEGIMDSPDSLGGGGKVGKYMKKKGAKSTLMADNTRGLITTKLTKPYLLLISRRVPSE